MRSNRSVSVLIVAIGIPLLVLLWLAWRSLERFDLAVEHLMKAASSQFAAAVAKRVSDDFTESFFTVIEQIDHEKMLRWDAAENERLIRSRDGLVCFVDGVFIARAPLDDGAFRFFTMSVHGRPVPTQGSSVLADAGFIAFTRRNVLQAAARGNTVRFWEHDGAAGRHHVLVHLLYDWDRRSLFTGLIGFTVDRRRLREHYYPEMARQLVAQHRENAGDLPAVPIVSIFDGDEEVYRSGRSLAGQYEAEQRIPAIFVDKRQFRSWNDDPPQALSYLRIRTGYESGSVSLLMRQHTQPLRWLCAALSLLAIGGLWVAAQSTYRELRLARLKQDFFSTLSHDARTPLSNIRLFADTLKERRTLAPEKAQQYYAILSRQAQQLSHLIGGMLDFAKMEAGVRTYPRIPVDLKATLQCTCDAYQHELEQGGFSHELVLPADDVSVLGDPDALGQLFGNLLDNAIKYSGERRFVGVALSTGDGVARVEVTDRGIGIPSHETSKIFESFYRSSQSAHACHGSGLGLAIVAHLARVHNGRVTVASEVGTGSTFTVHLPLLRSTDR